MIARPLKRFAFRLALAMHEPDPDRMLRGMTSALFFQWLAFAELEPWGFEVENWRTGQVCATTANFSMCSKKHDFKAADFTPAPPEPPLTLADKIRALMSPRKA